jgi:allophanate hydrolase subunit 1
MPELWIPGAAGPLDAFVDKVQRQIEAFAREHGLAQAAVEIELVDGTTYVIESLSAEPGFGFLTLTPHGEEPEALIVPVGALKRIAIGRSEERARLGFTLPQ